MPIIGEGYGLTHQGAPYFSDPSRDICLFSTKAFKYASIVHRDWFEGPVSDDECSWNPAGAGFNDSVHAIAEWDSPHFATAEAACLARAPNQSDAVQAGSTS